MPDPGAAFYLDTVSICNFALANCLDLIEKRYGKRTTVTSEVMDEIAEGLVQGYAPLARVMQMLEEDRFQTTTLAVHERKLYAALLQNLGAGEASAIACAIRRGGTVVTDDRAARSACEEHSVPFTGR